MEAHVFGAQETEDPKMPWWLRALELVLNWPQIHQRPNRHTAFQLWADAPDKELAKVGIQRRSSSRGRSVASTLVFAGFLVAAEVALIGYGFTSSDRYLKQAVKPTIIGLAFMFWGMWPTAGNLVPRWRGDESAEALQRSEFDWFLEDTKRSSAQREQLWRLRVAMILSLLCAMVTLVMFLFA